MSITAGARLPISQDEGLATIVAPYITSWSDEVDPLCTVVAAPGGGIAYADESMIDRDSQGVLWRRASMRPGHGRPLFGKVHALRQRRAMRRLLCQVCGGPADRTDDGVLWLLQDHRHDWPGWPEAMGVTEPPICVDCVRLSIRLCPALRKGAVTIRVRQFPVAAVRGCLYSRDADPVAIGDVTMPFTNPAIRRVRAVNLVRHLTDCTIVDIGDL